MRSLVLFSALALAACNNGRPQLTRVAEFNSSAKCPNGGVRIETGTDTSTNGTLDDGEVSSSTELCTGAIGGDGPEGPAGPAGDGGASGPDGGAGANALVISTPLANGSAQCPTGGMRIDLGADDGAGGGTAGNGTLEAGEISDTRYLCNGGFPFFPGVLTPPAAPAGAFTVDSSGGSGTVNSGGSGGNIQVQLGAGTLGGHAKVFRTGVADAGFALPATPAFVPGTQPLVVSGILTINAYADRAAGIASADPTFWVVGDEFLFANVGGVATRVTSIDIPAGAHLVLPYDGDGCRVVVHRDIRNAGTIRVGANGLDSGAISLVASSYDGLPGSTVSLVGGAGAGNPGGHGGFLSIIASRRIINQGNLLNFGGDGTVGGNSNLLELRVNQGEIVNTGTIDTRGGVATTGAGGNGGRVQVVSRLRGVRNSGTIDTRGANGGTAGGTGGAVSLSAASQGSVLNSGALTTRGGNCTGGSCSGGNGGAAGIEVYGGELVSSGNVDVSGGNGTGAGGNAATIKFHAYDDTEDDPLPVAVGSVRVSGNLASRGGNGSSGGNGDEITVGLWADNLPRGQEIELLGYTDLISNGGSATAGGNGGVGGSMSISNTTSKWFGLQTPSGGAVLYANVSARGGDGQVGGAGGGLSVTTQEARLFNNANEVALSLGTTIDLRGGNGSNANAGNGGEVFVFGTAGATNAAALSLQGGTVSGSPGPVSGGHGGSATFIASTGAVTNSGAIGANGGSSSDRGGSGGAAFFEGTLVTNSGAISCNGANGTNQGGSGGRIWLNSQPGSTTVATLSQLSVSAGSGTAAGSKGHIAIDAVDVTP